VPVPQWVPLWGLPCQAPFQSQLQSFKFVVALGAAQPQEAAGEAAAR
jgi:hypothetical protein